MKVFNLNFRRRQRRAFTLIEIMVAIAIFALLIAAVYSTWVLILKSKQIGDEATAQAQRQRIAIRTIEDSLTCIQSFQASMKYYVFGVTNGDQPSFSYVARVPDIFPRNGRFDSNLRRLTFSVEPVSGSDSEKDLVLRQNPILIDIDADEQATPLVLARNVKSFVVECWDTNAMDWATGWDDTNSLPPMVRVKLTLGGNTTGKSSTANTLAITREIAVPSQTLPGIIQNGSAFGGGGGGGGGNISFGGNNQTQGSNNKGSSGSNGGHPPGFKFSGQ
jgi:prepilin-type N-terminal cleavage/methylation domain-containing protein